jgi:hypothetical protein
MPPSEDRELQRSDRLSPDRRRAFGYWVRAVYALVAHLDVCPFGCTAEEMRCPAGVEAADDEQAEWHTWREAR